MLYIVRGEGYRTKNNFDNPIEIYKEFKNENPLVAREKSFIFFQSLIEVLLEGIGKEYSTHEEAEQDLINYFHSDKKTTKLGLPYVEMGVGFSITFVYDETIEYENKKIKIYKKEKVIHGIENENSEQDYKKIYLKNLIFEKKFYQEAGFVIEKNKNTSFNIISSPIDFDLMYIKRYL